MSYPPQDKESLSNFYYISPPQQVGMSAHESDTNGITPPGATPMDSSHASMRDGSVARENVSSGSIYNYVCNLPPPPPPPPPAQPPPPPPPPPGPSSGQDDYIGSSSAEANSNIKANENSSRPDKACYRTYASDGTSTGHTYNARGGPSSNYNRGGSYSQYSSTDYVGHSDYDVRSEYHYSNYQYGSYGGGKYYGYPAVTPAPAYGHRYGSSSSSSSSNRSRSDYYSRSSSSYGYGSTATDRYNVPQTHSTGTSSYAESSRAEKRPRVRDERPAKPETERDRLLRMWRSNYCETPEDIQRKMEELAEMDEDCREVWIRSSPADPYYRRTQVVKEVEGTTRLDILCQLFEEELIKRADRVREKLPPYKPSPRKNCRRVCKHKSEGCSSSDSDSSDNEEFKLEQDNCMEELSRKLQHPYRIHADLWHNEMGEMNDGPLCRCSLKSRRVGIRHGIYPGEKSYAKCNPNSNNANKLHHYRITISPPTNFLTKTPTIIKHDEHEFIFEGFSLLSHFPLVDLPTCKVIRFNIEYTILYVPEKMPENFTAKELDLFCKWK